MRPRRLARAGSLLFVPCAFAWIACASQAASPPSSPEKRDPAQAPADPTPADPAPASDGCPEGQKFFKPGCGSSRAAVFVEGCYSACSESAPCGSGFVCKVVNYDPCHNDLCDACGSEGRICMKE